MRFILERVGLYVYGVISIVESILNLLLYVTMLDKIITPVDWSFPFYFKYTNSVLKGYYLDSLKESHGKNL